MKCNLAPKSFSSFPEFHQEALRWGRVGAWVQEGVLEERVEEGGRGTVIMRDRAWVPRGMIAHTTSSQL